MNTLSYGLLGLLTLRPCSGYDLMQEIQTFWPAKHSQIYPLLAMMEQQKLITYEYVSQTDKPDKKVYSVTEKGLEELNRWMERPCAEPVVKDELMLKTFCLWNADREQARGMFAERERLYEAKLDYLRNKLKRLAVLAGCDPEQLPLRSRYFGVYLLLRKAVANTESNLDWCRWAMRAIESGDRPG